MIPNQVGLVLAVLLGAALRGLVAALAVWVGLRLLRVSNVMALKAAWSLVLVAALAMPLAPERGMVPAWAALRLPSPAAWNSAKPAAAPSLAETPDTAARYDSIDWSAYAGAPRRTQEPRKTQGTTAAQTESVPAATSAAVSARTIPATTTAPRSNRAALCLAWGAAAVYLAVFAGLLLRLLVGVAAAGLIWRKAEPVTAPGLANAVAGPLRASPQVASPVNIGSGILLPADYAAWENRKLRIVLAHESSHIRQWDFYLQLLAGFYAALFWFSPLGWWLKRKLYELGEAISDRAGLEEAGSRSNYAQLLLEFAALPRPTLTGVAMARTSHLAQRIERLLNETHFRRSFAAGGRRALAAVLLVPVALIAAAALVRVEAATPARQDQALAQTATTGQSTPEPVTDQAPLPPEPQDAAPNANVPPPPPGPGPSPEAQPGPRPFGAEPGAQPHPPMPPNPETGLPPMPSMAGEPPLPPMPGMDHGRHFGSGFGYGPMGQPYAIVDADGKVILPNGTIRMSEEGPRMEGLDKARKSAHGPFLWFERDDKSYIVQDSSVVNQVEAMNKSMENLHEQMSALGKQMRAIGDQQREMGRKMHDATVQTPDLTKEIADLNAAAAALKAKQGATISQKDLGDLQRQVGRIQGELGALQGKIGMQAFHMDEMGKFGGQMGELGGQMGKIGAEMGKQARDNHDKIEGIIKDSLANGKAKPVE